MTKVGEVAAPRAVYSRLNLVGMILAGAVMGLTVALRAAGLLTGTYGDIPRILLPGLILIVPAHEGLHWVTAVLLGVPRRDCHFGVYWQKLMPYFRAAVPVPVRSYRVILLAPGVVLFCGLLPPALLTRNVAWVILVGMAFVAGVGDYYWYWRIRALPRGRWVWDKAGLVGLEVLVHD
ncbi:MAG: DUF3267 domain-containing protein [Planctomycetota bacterium]|nr:DUF3267 domain-containing protein [Planctomycetota bacterium]